MKLGLCTWSCHKSFEAKKIDFAGLLKYCAKDLKLGGIDIIADHLPKSDKNSLLEYKKMACDLS